MTERSLLQQSIVRQHDKRRNRESG